MASDPRNVLQTLAAARPASEIWAAIADVLISFVLITCNNDITPSLGTIDCC